MIADHIQLHIACDGRQAPTGTIEEYVGVIRHWMRTNMLALNDSKTEVIHFSTTFYGQGPVPSCDLRVSIPPYNSVCNLGVIIDSAGTMSTHVSKLRKSASFALWKIIRITTFLDQRTTLQVIHVFATSRMDYFNSQRFCLPSNENRSLKILQHISSPRQEKMIT